MRLSAAQLARGSTLRTFACSQMIMPVLQQSERHCPIWHCSFEIEARDCPLGLAPFLFRSSLPVRPLLAETLTEKSPFQISCRWSRLRPGYGEASLCVFTQQLLGTPRENSPSLTFCRWSGACDLATRGIVDPRG